MDATEPRFDYERARLTLDELVFDGSCQLCGRNEWQRPAFGHALAIVLATMDGEPLVGPEGESVSTVAYALVCNGCGYVRLHAASIVEWHADRLGREASAA
jgi:hypothetical protein